MWFSDDSGATTIWDTTYTPDADTNQYTGVGGASNGFDAMEQKTQDGNTGLYHAYDYKGQLVATDKDSDLATPERQFAHDCQGLPLLKTDNNGTSDLFHAVSAPLVACSGCSCSAAEFIAAEIETLDDSGTTLTSELNFTGGIVESTGSSSAVHPATATVAPQGRGNGNAVVAQWIYVYSNSSEGWRFLGHNAHGSLISVTDLNGYRTDMYVYTDYDAAAHHKVIFDGQDWRISSVAADTPGPGKTTITIAGTTGLSTELLNGCELVISRPTSSGDRYITARVDDTTSTTIVVTDAGSTSAPVYLALNGQTQGFVVCDFHTGDNTTGGTWTEAPGYNSMLGLTRFTDSTASFAAFMLGWTVILDVEKPSFLTIFGVPPGGLSVEVRGDASGLAASGAKYRVIAPPGVDSTTCALGGFNWLG